VTAHRDEGMQVLITFVLPCCIFIPIVSDPFGPKYVAYW